ncbi:MAG: hypothetical protein HY305_00925 [Sphingobacteriales bacterium]|nr:hypothetical protein [Sphingobacteriales bacterium]
MKKLILLGGFACTLILSACNKTDTFQQTSINDYYPLEVGKYIIYNLDSIVTVNFGQRLDTVNYQVKYLVDGQLTDNLLRPAYRIVRSIRKDSTQGWTIDNSFMAVNTGNTLEFVDDNNLRFVKLRLPVKYGFSWKGNTFIDTKSATDPNFQYLDDWDYKYDSINYYIPLGNKIIDSTIKVAQIDETDTSPILPSRNFSEEKYAKGIGLIYKNTVHWVYQPPNLSTAGFYSGSGIILTMIDHN